MHVPQDIRAVLFDFGGTLAYDEPGYAEGYVRLCTALGYPATLPSYRSASDGARAVLPEAPRDLEGFLAWRVGFRREQLRRLGVPEDRLEAVMREIALRFRYYSRPRCYPETHYVLRCLRRAGYLVGVISNIQPVLPLALEELELDQYLSFAIASDTFGADKPDRRIFEEGLRLAAVPPEATIYVGDSVEADVEGSLPLGILPVLIDRRAMCADRPGILRVTNLTQLLDWLGVGLWDDEELHEVAPSRG